MTEAEILTVLVRVLGFSLLFSAVHRKEGTSLRSQQPQPRSTGEKASIQRAIWSPVSPAELGSSQPADPRARNKCLWL